MKDRNFYINALIFIIMSLGLILDSKYKNDKNQLEKNWLFINSIIFMLLATLIYFNYKKSKVYIYIVMISLLLITNMIKFLFAEKMKNDKKIEEKISNMFYIFDGFVLGVVFVNIFQDLY